MEDEDQILDEPVTGESISGEQCIDDSPLTKWSEPTPDRLSELPDLAIVHILSYRYFDEAARTSLLSKRFNSLWNSVTALNFSDESSGKIDDRFVSFVDTALGFHHRPQIEKFSLKFRYNLICSKAVDGWIKVAVKKQVLSPFEEHSLSPALSERKNLTLSIPVIKWNHLGIASILHSSPYLETLIIRISCCSDVEFESTGGDHY